jgi:hypothetical protein
MHLDNFVYHKTKTHFDSASVPHSSINTMVVQTKFNQHHDNISCNNGEILLCQATRSQLQRSENKYHESS